MDWLIQSSAAETGTDVSKYKEVLQRLKEAGEKATIVSPDMGYLEINPPFLNRLISPRAQQLVKNSPGRSSRQMCEDPGPAALDPTKSALAGLEE